MAKYRRTWAVGRREQKRWSCVVAGKHSRLLLNSLFHFGTAFASVMQRRTRLKNPRCRALQCQCSTWETAIQMKASCFQQRMISAPWSYARVDRVSVAVCQALRSEGLQSCHCYRPALKSQPCGKRSNFWSSRIPSFCRSCSLTNESCLPHLNKIICSALTSSRLSIR